MEGMGRGEGVGIWIGIFFKVILIRKNLGVISVGYVLNDGVDNVPEVIGLKSSQSNTGIITRCLMCRTG